MGVGDHRKLIHTVAATEEVKGLGFIVSQVVARSDNAISKNRKRGFTEWKIMKMMVAHAVSPVNLSLEPHFNFSMS